MAIRNIKGLPESPQTPQGWFAWADAVMRHRLRVHDETESPDLGLREVARAREIVLSQRSFLYMANTYGSIYEARQEEGFLADTDLGDDPDEWDWDLVTNQMSRSIIIPYITYPFQIETSDWLDRRMVSKGVDGDGFIVKARDMGITNTTMFWVAHKWLFRQPFQGRLLSRNENLVDQTGNPDTMFWKIDSFLMGLPEWLLRAGVGQAFDWKTHRLMMRLINPRNMNLISGESTNAEAGRAGRSTVFILDEVCAMEGLSSIVTSSRANTNHRLYIGTPSTKKGMDCFNLAHGEEGYTRPPTLQITWDQHPKHDNAWLEDERKRDNGKGFAQEVLMDWHATESGWVYPEAQAYKVGHYPYVPNRGDDIYVAIDPGSDDDFAMVFIQYLPDTGRVRVLDSYRNKHMPIDFYASILRLKPLANFTYDPEAQRLMNWWATMPREFTVVSDTDLKRENLETASSAYERLALKWGIYVLINPLKRSAMDRRTLTGGVLTKTDFNDTPGAQFALTSLQRYRFQESEEGEERQYEQTKALHSKWSHMATAFEFFCTNFDVFRYAMSSGASIVYTGERNKG